MHFALLLFFGVSKFTSPFSRPALFSFYELGGLTVAQANRIAVERMNGGSRESSVFPRDVHCEAAAGAQAIHAAGGPRFRQRGQELDLVILALQQHFSDAGGAAEIAVNLKRRMRIKHVGKRARRTHQKLSL